MKSAGNKFGRIAPVVVVAVWIGACSEEGGWMEPDLGPDPTGKYTGDGGPYDTDSKDREGDNAVTDNLPWPEFEDPLPECSGTPMDFAMPELDNPDGDIHLDVSAKLQPVGYTERLSIEVYRKGTKELDSGFRGSLKLSVGDQSPIQIEVVNGVAQTNIVFKTNGTYGLIATLDDGRTGGVQVLAYTTQLPVWEVEIEKTIFDEMLINIFDKTKHPVTLTVDNKIEYPGEMRIHGGSSRSYPKKSFRIDLDDGHELPDKHNKLIARAEWNDKTMMRNAISMDMFRNGTWLPTPKTEQLNLRINGRFYGLMTRVDRIGGDFLKTNGRNKEGSMYEADPAQVFWNPGGNLTPLVDYDTYVGTYDHKKGDIDYTDLISLIEETLQLPDDEFIEKITEVLNLDSYLVYIATMAVLQNHDHVKKNYYIYRNPEAGDDRWEVFPWDLDLTFGHVWTEENDVLDETIFFEDTVIDGQKASEESTFYNMLMHRIGTTQEFKGKYISILLRITKETFTTDFVQRRIDNILCRATPEILADASRETEHRMRASLDEYLERVNELIEFTQLRREYILGLFGG